MLDQNDSTTRPTVSGQTDRSEGGRPPGRLVRRWSLRVVAGFCLLVLLLASPMACTTTIVPPRVAEGAGVSVALVDHGRHASLVLPDGGGGMTRWEYGERLWYAENQTGFLRVFPTLLWPTKGTLGRRRLPGPVSEANIRQRVGIPIESMWIIRVEPSQARALHAELDALFEQHVDTLLTNANYDLDFVDHPDDYSYFHNCNHKVAAWLERLGCEVRGFATASSWDVEPVR